MYKQIEGKPPPKNGFFYTIDELKEYGVYNYNLDPGKDEKKSETKTVPKKIEIPKETLKEKSINQKKGKKKDEKTKKESGSKKDLKKIKKTKGKIKVSIEDKLSWITKNGERILIYNNQEIRGKKGYILWKKYKLLKQDEIDKKEENKRKEESSDDEYKDEVIEIE